MGLIRGSFLEKRLCIKGEFSVFLLTGWTTLKEVKILHRVLTWTLLPG